MAQIGSLTRETVLMQSGDLITGEMDGEVVMMSIERGKYYALNGVGSCIWPMLATPCSMAVVCGRLFSKFDVEPALGEAEVMAFFSEMLEKGVVTVVRS